MAAVPAHVFRAYDIRGVAENDVTEELCGLVGRGFGTELRERYGKEQPSVIVGRDARTHSPAFEVAVIEGLLATGCRVLRIGQVPSPVNYFTLCNLGADGSVQVTASHNPKEDNGLKLQLQKAEAFAGEELQGLLKRIEEKRFLTGKGSEEIIDAKESYIARVTSLVNVGGAPAGRPYTIVVDTGNGVAGPIYTEALRRAGYEVIGLFTEPDGTFPNHIADPSKHETLKTLQETVRKEKADCGIAFDGDGDRVGFVDETGKIVPPDLLLLLLAEDHLARNPGASIISTVSMSSIIESEVKRLGGNPVMCIVGHSFVEHAMKEHKSHLGGEQSGHFFCGEDFYDHDDALVAALRILKVFARKRREHVMLSEAPPRASTRSSTSSERLSMTWRREVEARFSSLFSPFPRVFQSPERRPHCPDEKKAEVIRRITDHFAAKYPCITIDGVRIDFGDGAWAGIRQSNTSPRISVCMEARTPEKLREVEAIVQRHLRGYAELGD